MADTGKKYYSLNESVNRILRVLVGKKVPTDTPETVPGSVLSIDEALSKMAEVVEGNDAEEEFTLPGFAVFPTTSAPTGTAMGNLGGRLYAEGGALKWYGSSGTISTIAGS